MYIVATEIDVHRYFLTGEYNPSGRVFTDIYFNSTGFIGKLIVTNYRLIFIPDIVTTSKPKISVHLMSIMLVTLKAPSQETPIIQLNTIKLTLKDLREIKFAHC